MKTRCIMSDTCPRITSAIVRAVQIYTDDTCLGYMGAQPMAQEYRDYALANLRRNRKDWFLARGYFLRDYLKPRAMNAQARFWLAQYEALEKQFITSDVENFVNRSHELLRNFAAAYSGLTLPHPNA